MSSTGKLLRGFDFSECSTAAAAAGGVNETRGVSRSRLLKALADELPPGALRFNSRVTGFSNQQAGACCVLQTVIHTAAPHSTARM